MEIIGLLILPILYGFFEGLMDKINFHYDSSRFSNYQNQSFFNPTISWKNKYKEDLKTPKFKGSTTWLVFTTDAWHLFKWFRNRCLNLYLIYILFLITIKMSVLIYILIIGFPILSGIGFWLGYRRLFNKKYNAH